MPGVKSQNATAGKANISFKLRAGEHKLEVMSARQAKFLFLVLIVLVTLLFFLHVPSGGYQSKNGPTTPVDNLNLRLALAGLLLSLAVNVAMASRLAMNSLSSHFSLVFPQSHTADSTGISLRC